MKTIVYTLLLVLALPTFATTILNKKIVNASSMSAATIESDPVNIRLMDFIAIQAKYTGAPVGDFKLQASNALTTAEASLVDEDFTDLTDSALSIDAAGDFMWNIQRAGYKWIRLVYTKTSGSGTLTVYFNGKGF